MLGIKGSGETAGFAYSNPGMPLENLLLSMAYFWKETFVNICDKRAQKISLLPADTKRNRKSKVIITFLGFMAGFEGRKL